MTDSEGPRVGMITTFKLSMVAAASEVTSSFGKVHLSLNLFVFQNLIFLFVALLFYYVVPPAPSSAKHCMIAFQFKFKQDMFITVVV